MQASNPLGREHILPLARSCKGHNFALPLLSRTIATPFDSTFVPLTLTTNLILIQPFSCRHFHI